MLNKDGQLNKAGIRARVQVVLFNPIFDPVGRLRAGFRRLRNTVMPEDKQVPLMSNRINRRTHDKIIVADGRFPNLARAIIGGRNISIHHYGLDEAGKPSIDADQDLTVLIRNVEGVEDSKQFGSIMSDHFEKLFMHLGNKRLHVSVFGPIRNHIMKMQDSYEILLSNETFNRVSRQADEFLKPILLKPKLNGLMNYTIQFQSIPLLVQKKIKLKTQTLLVNLLSHSSPKPTSD